MKNSAHLDQYNLILIRYNEIWLKSMKVKIRMLKIMMKNIKNMLNRESIPFNKYQLSKDTSRVFFFFKNEDISNALEVMSKTFGIFSFSPALRTSNKLKNIIDRAVEVSRLVMKKGDSFAIRVKRSGKHDFSSQDVAKKVGKAVLDANTEKGLKVNLSSPVKKIFIEVRGDFSYIFTDIIKSEWGGLPIENSKKILAMDVGRLNDLLAGFLLMRRGATIYPVLFEITDKIELFDEKLSNWKEFFQFVPYSNFSIKIINIMSIMEVISSKLEDQKYFCATCRLVRFDIASRLLNEPRFHGFNSIRAISDGISLNDGTICPDEIDLESINIRHFFSKFPIFTPLVALDTERIKDYLSTISKKLVKLDYCRFKPKGQEIDVEKLKSLYDSLNLNQLIEESIKNIKDIKISWD